MLLIFGCGTIDKGADPIVVNAERSTKIALVTFDAFLRYEYENKDLLAGIDPSIHKFAEQIRKSGKKWIESANNLTVVYKVNRTEENRFNLVTALAVLQAAMTESEKYIKIGVTRTTP